MSGTIRTRSLTSAEILVFTQALQRIVDAPLRHAVPVSNTSKYRAIRSLDALDQARERAGVNADGAAEEARTPGDMFLKPQAG
jgi:hypothetical protein